MYISSLCPLLLAVAFAATDGFNYEEIRKLNASCIPKDTCAIARDVDHLERHNCDCSSLCVLYNTCCIDAPMLNFSNNQYGRQASCQSIDRHTNAFLIDSCPDSYDGPITLRRRCEMSVEDWSDPFANIPSTNPISMKTYKSLFCAICHGEKINELVMWQVAMDCTGLGDGAKMCERMDFVLSNMVYLREKSQWGIWSFDSATDWGFKTLTLGLKIPDSVKSFVKECRPNLKSTCADDWVDDRVRSLCGKYMAAVYTGQNSYRNVHCAICNYAWNSTTGMSCDDTSSSMYRGGMNFAHLLDIDISDGANVGTVENKTDTETVNNNKKTCSVNQIFDPFAQKCRTMECVLPGYVLKNMKCVPG